MDNRINSLKRIYIRSFRRGRSSAAYFFDSVIVWSAVFVGVYLAVRPRVPSRPAAVFLSLACVLLCLALRSIAARELLSRHIKKLRKSAGKELSEIKLMKEPDRLFGMLPGSAQAVLKTDLLTADDIKGMDGKTVITLAEPTDKAKKLIDALGIKLVLPQEYLGVDLSEVFPVTESETDEYLIRKYSNLIKKPSLPKSLLSFSRARAVKFLATGAGLLIMSFFMRYSLYYRLAASLVISIGFTVLCADALKASAYSKAPR